MRRLNHREEDLKRCFQALRDRIGEVLYFDSVSSTMDVARSLDEREIVDRTLIVTDVQTQGRGTFGRKWYSLEGSLIFSFVLAEYSMLVPYSMIAAYAVFKTFRRYTHRVSLKWVNDVLWENGKKVSGVLSEESNGRTVIGAGVNLNLATLPPPLRHIATSYLLETGVRLSTDEFLFHTIDELLLLLNRIAEGELHGVLTEWEKDASLCGRRVRLSNERGEYRGVISGIDKKSGALRLVSMGKVMEFYEGSLLYES